jgi:hypothetical protein
MAEIILEAPFVNGNGLSAEEEDIDFKGEIETAFEDICSHLKI